MLKKIAKVLTCSFIIISMLALTFNVQLNYNKANNNTPNVAYANAADIWSGAIQQPLGAGVELDPYLISTAEELAWVANESMLGTGFSGVYFTQTADIDLGGQGDILENIYIQQKWTPIGLGDAEISSTPFSGIYDGANFVIYNMYIDEAVVGNNQGLFGYIVNGEIKNLRLDNAIVETSQRNSGLLAGKIDGTTIDNCYVSGSIDGGDIVGAIVGEAANNSTISGSTNVAKVNGNVRIGGIAAYLKNSAIINCANLGAIISNSSDPIKIGGIVGENNAGNISLTYNVGEIKTLYSQNDAGEIAGSNGGNISNVIYEANLVNGTTVGLVGINTSTTENIQSGVDLASEGFDIGGGGSVWETVNNAYPEQAALAGADFNKIENLVVRCKVTQITKDGGSLSSDGIEIVNPFDNYTVEINPNYNWEISTVYINGVEVSTTGLNIIKETNSYTFSNIQSDQEIEVAFVEAVMVTITYDTNSTVNNIIVEMKKGNNLALLPMPVREGYVLEGWYTSTEGGTRVTEDTVIDGVATYYAVWANAAIDVILNPNGGTGTQISLELDYNETLASKTYETPTKAGYVFAGWNTLADGSGEEISENDTLTYSLSLYAQWEKDSSSIFLIVMFIGIIAAIIAGLFISVSAEKAIKDKPMAVAKKSALKTKETKKPKKRGLGNNYTPPSKNITPLSKSSGPSVKAPTRGPVVKRK